MCRSTVKSHLPFNKVAGAAKEWDDVLYIKVKVERSGQGSSIINLSAMTDWYQVSSTDRLAMIDKPIGVIDRLIGNDRLV